MLGLKASEIAVLLVIASVVIPPGDLPAMLRSLGRLIGWVRRSL
jgi:Sec-independent protein translocase protein TatA